MPHGVGGADRARARHRRARSVAGFRESGWRPIVIELGCQTGEILMTAMRRALMNFRAFLLSQHLRSSAGMIAF